MITSSYFGEGGEGAAAARQAAADVEARKRAEIAAIGQRQQQRQASASSAAAPVQLQNALKALGTMAGDPSLTKIKVDGIIGPQTVKLVNYAIEKYHPAGQYFPRGNLHIGTVRSYAGGIASEITKYIQQRGGSVPTPQVQKAVARYSSVMPSIPIPAPEPEADRKWIWWVVGGVSVLLVLTMAASVAKKHRQAPAAAAAA